MSIQQNRYAPPQADVAATEGPYRPAGSRLIRALAGACCVAPALYSFFHTLPLLYSRLDPTVTLPNLVGLGVGLVLLPAARLAAGLLLWMSRYSAALWTLVPICLLNALSVLALLRFAPVSSSGVTWLVVQNVILLLVTVYAAVCAARQRRYRP
jgi:hypothetical protein